MRNRTKVNRTIEPKLRHPALHLVLLALFLLSGQGQLQMLLMSAAQLDGQHQVGLIQSGNNLQIVLSHQPDNAATRPQNVHEHGALTEMVTLLATTQSEDPDHVILIERNPVRSSSATRSHPLISITTTAPDLAPRSESIKDVFYTSRPEASRSAPYSLLQHRTTVFLI